jgi:hypothetical protein
MQQMISLDKVKQMQQQLSDLVELTGELQKELIHNLIARRDALLLPESALQEDKNLGVLLRPTEGLRVMPVATAAFPVLRPAAKHADKDCTAQCFLQKCVRLTLLCGVTRLCLTRLCGAGTHRGGTFAELFGAVGGRQDRSRWRICRRSGFRGQDVPLWL